MKKLAALLLVLIITLALSVPAMAENPTASSETGIIDGKALDEIIESYASNYPANITGRFSVGLIYTATGDSYYYNGDAWYYSGSVYKVPVCMLLAEEVAAGNLAQDTVIQSPRGSYDVSYLEYTSIVNSDNNSGHTIVDYFKGTFNGKCADQLMKYTSLDESYFTEPNFFEYSYYSPRFICEVLNTLYTEQERFPNIIDLMKLSMPGHYMKAGIPEYDVAQKYGALVDSSGVDWNNCVGIIYSENPVIISVMTKNVGGYENFIAEISRRVMDYALTLDEKLPAYLAEHAPTPTEAPAEPSETVPASESNDMSTAPESVAAKAPEAPAPAQPVVIKGDNSFVFTYLVPALAVISLVLYIISACIPSKKHR